MLDDFNFKTLEFERKLSLDHIKEKIQTLKETKGIYSPLGDRGGRWTPEDWDLPTIYFSSNGLTLEVVMKDMDISIVDNFLCDLAQALECKILGEHLEYY